MQHGEGRSRALGGRARGDPLPSWELHGLPGDISDPVNPPLPPHTEPVRHFELFISYAPEGRRSAAGGRSQGLGYGVT